MTRIATHPGEMLYHEFMVPLGLSARALARKMEVPPNRIAALLKGERVVTADTALRLEKVLGMPAMFWMRLQGSHDLSKAMVEVDYSHIEPIERKVA